MAESVVKSYFPSQVVSDAEKLSYDYGLKVAKAIETEWFYNDYNQTRYTTNKNNYHNLRLYARGEQSIQKYKDELSINGDLSYLNLDWTPVPIIPKFVDIVVNGIAERTYDITAFSQDPYGVAQRNEYMRSLLKDMRIKDFNDFVGFNSDGTYGNIYFNDTLNDWAKFDINKRTKFDATISSGLAIMACNRHLYAPNVKVEKQKLNIHISKYSNNGNMSQIIKE